MDLAAELWSLAPLYCKHARDVDAFAALAPGLVAALSDGDGDRRRVACDCVANFGEQVGAGALAASTARGALPALFGCALDDAVDASGPACRAVAAVAPLADPKFVAAIFKKLAQRLLTTVAAATAKGIATTQWSGGVFLKKNNGIKWYQ